MKSRKYDFFKKKKLNYSELDNEIKIEIAILGGLDIFTDAHVKGVVDATAKICEEMGMEYEKMKRCVLCAYLHDVGKIHIPSEILQKNGKLTDEEFAKMKQHTEYGYDICMRYNQFRELAPIVRAHHESLDGSGYPDGLKGDEIPEEAKLIKVADVYDALTKRRQYKEGFKKSKAIDILLEDVEKGKTAPKYLYYLILNILSELESVLQEYEELIKGVNNEIEILKELEKIYKQIYDQGFTPKLAKKLSKYELESGYDMSTNANLLVIKQQKLERMQNELKDLEEEEEKLRIQAKTTEKLISDEDWIEKI
ncbi:MAG: HD domain-containing protein [Clostridia bacterium]|nr:HD domain-containing protein [Clostridia bacterium]